MKKRIFCMIAALLLALPGGVYASVLGESLYEDALAFGDGVVYNDNLFFSDQVGVGYQNEHYFTYTPNPSVVPVVTTGGSVYGRRTITQMTDYLHENGMTPIMGMNADYFSFQTGVPMGHTITGGEILTKSEDGQDAIGFRKDGSAFISWLEIRTVLQSETQTIPIANINKYRLASRIYMMTDAYYSDTRASGWGVDVILTPTDGRLAIGDTVTCVVDDVDYHDGSIPIPKGKYVLSLDAKGDSELYHQLESLKVGETVTITNTAVGDGEGLWESAEYATGTVGGRLLSGGELTGLDDSAAPRTAIGIKENGDVLFYTIDGRQDSSYGVRLATLARRMKELGCVDALNMDGGGSTSVNGVYPGNNPTTLLNNPSDGTLRQVSDFFALINTAEADGQAKKLHLYPYGGLYLAGATETFTVKATDGGGYATDAPQEVAYSVTGEGSEYLGEHQVRFGTEDTTVTVSAGDTVSDPRAYRVVTTPDDLKVYGENSGQEITKFSVDAGSGVKLSAKAWFHYQEVSADDTCFTWKLVDDSDYIGTVDSEGTFIAGDYAGKGNLIVSAGNCSKTIPVTVKGKEYEGSFMQLSLSEQDGTVTGTMTPSYEVGLNWLALTVDHKEVKVNLNRDKTEFTYPLEDGKFHKLLLKVGNDDDYACLTSLEVGDPSTLTNAFADMKGHWAEKPVNLLYRQHLVSGFSEKELLYYKPSQQMTRAEFAVLLCKFKNLQASDASAGLSDENSLPSWAKPYINAVVKAGLIQGNADGKKRIFSPNQAITRAEVAAILCRTLTDGYPKTDLTAKDASSVPSWAKEAMRQLTAMGVISGYTDGTLKPNQAVTRAEAAQMLYQLY